MRPHRRELHRLGQISRQRRRAVTQSLYDLIRAPKRFVSVAGAGHNDLGARAVAEAKKFVAER